VYGSTAMIDGPHTFADVQLLGGATLTHSATTTTDEYRLELTVTDALIVDATSKIDVTARGYLSRHTLGNTIEGGARGYAGGSHGGTGWEIGSSRTNATYGDPRNPTDLGAGGGSDSGQYYPGGGGATLINATVLTLDGAIRADGANAVATGTGMYHTRYGAGAGGSVRLDVGALTGAGTISANGGNGTQLGLGPYGAGSGGRVAIYYDTSDGFDFENVTADTGGPSYRGAPGTVYLEQTGGPTVLRIASDQAATGRTPIPGTELVVDQLIVAGASVYATPKDVMTIYATQITISDGATLEVAAPEPFDHGIVGGTLDILTGGRLTHRNTSTTREYKLTVIADTITVDVDSSIDVSSRGYLSRHTLGNTIEGGARGYAGGSHGGTGWEIGSSRTNATYGDPRNPKDLGAGGGSDQYYPGGGGAVLINATVLTLDGAIRADGADAVATGSGMYDARYGAGAGGSVRLNVGGLTGAGTISANGGNGTQYGLGLYGAGGGGRVAVYARDTMTLPAENILAAGGTGPGGVGGDGTIEFPAQPLPDWDWPLDRIWHGAEWLQWTGLGLDPAEVTVRIEAHSGQGTYLIAAGLPPVGRFLWDTTTVPDDRYEIRATFRNAGGAVVGQLRREDLLVNNSVVWHEGVIGADETWSSEHVHGIEKTVTVADGVTLTIEPGAIVKLAADTGLVVVDGGTLDAPGTFAEPIIITTLTDDTADGDTNRDGSASRPRFGESLGINVPGTGQANLTEHVELRYAAVNHSGTIDADQVWLAWQLHRITGDLVVPDGVTLTIAPDAIVKLDERVGIWIDAGGRLLAEGTVAQPITFTSIHDDTIGGDTAGDGNATTPVDGDWLGIRSQGGDVVLDHVRMYYGGGSVTGTWNQSAMVVGRGTLAVANSVLQNSFFDGIIVYSGTAVVTNTVVTGAVRGIDVWNGDGEVINCTLDNNRIGVRLYNGTATVVNTIITGSEEYGVVQFGSNRPVVRYSNVWDSGLADFRNFSEPVPGPGTDGIISADPRYRDPARGDFRLRHDSPSIDAADDTAAPPTDAGGAPRFDDPWVPNGPGGFADMGAFEFVENAASTIDLVPSAVFGPADVVAGARVVLQWKITNTGSEAAVGPWRDRIGLVPHRDVDARELAAATVVVGEGVVLGPGEELAATADVLVPVGVAGDYFWRVTTNAKADVFEGQNYGNNVAFSLGTAALDLPRLAIGEVAAGELLPGQNQYYRFDYAGGDNVEITLDSADPAAFELRVGYREISERSTAIARRLDGSRQSFQLLGARPGDYYVLVHAVNRGLGASAFELAARVLSDGITTVTPSQGSNRGEVTVTIVAAGLPADPEVALVAPDGWMRAAQRIWRPDQHTVWATFDLQGLGVGHYDVRIGGDSVLLKQDGFEVTDGAAGRVVASISGPDVLRVGRPVMNTVTYANVGHTDVPAPLLVLVQPRRILDQGDVAMYLGIGAGGPAGILAPGESGSFSFPVMSGTIGHTSVQLGVLTADSPLVAEAVNWFGGKSALKPEHLPAAAWDVIFDNFVSLIGTTGGEVLASLGDLASYLSELGQRVSEVETLIAFAIQQAAGLSPVDFLAAAVDAIQPAPGMDMFFARTYQNGIAARHELGPLGWGWNHIWQLDLRFEYSGVVLTTVLVRDVAGATHRFLTDGSGGFVAAAPNNPDRLEALVGGGYELRRAEGSVLRYDADGRFTGMQEIDGNQFVPVYDAQGRLTRIEHSSGGFLQIAYNEAGRIASVADASGRAGTFQYDPTGEYLVLSTDREGRTAEYSYDTAPGSPAVRALRSVKLPDGTTQFFDYDAQGRLASQYGDGESAKTDFQYGPAGEVRLVAPWGNTTVYSYDAFGRLARVRNAVGSTRTYTYTDQGAHYDARAWLAWARRGWIDVDHHQGRLAEIIDAFGARTSYRYDAEGNLATVVDAAGNVVQWGYGLHPVPQPDYVTDAAGNTVSYQYDEDGLRVRRTMPDGTSEAFTYNEAGQVIRWTNRRGETVDYAYSADGLLTSKTYADETVFAYAYDAAGRLIEAAGPAGAVLREYDAQGRLARIEYPGGHFLEYIYDAAGRRETTTDGADNALTAHYDALGRLERLSDGAGSLVAAYSYDQLNRLERKELGNGVYTTYAYTGTGAIDLLTNCAPDGAVLSFYDYRYDALGQTVALVSADGTWTYGYDSLGQLVAADFASANPAIADQQVRYEYDAVGNRIRAVTNGASESYQANALYQYTQIGETTYEYDADGNLISKTKGGVTTEFVYNAENRLIAVHDGGSTRTYAYDAVGRLASVTENGQTRYFITDPLGLGAVVAEIDADGNIVKRYDSAGGLLRAMQAGGETHYYTFQYIGHTSELTDASGQVTDTYAYDPCGTMLHATGATPNPFQYVGEFGVMTVDADLMFMQNRLYSPTMGQFLSEDPLRFDGVNSRTYVDNAPIDAIDPAGLSFLRDAWNAAKALAGMTGNAVVTAAGLATAKLGIGVPVAVYGGYGVVGNATNFIRALQGKEPLSNGGLLGDTGAVVGHLTGVEALETVGNVLDLGTALVDPTKAITKAPEWFAKSKTVLDIAGKVATATGAGASTIDSADALFEQFVEYNKQLASEGKRLILVEGNGQVVMLVVGSLDPNEIIGPAGYGNEGFVPADTVLPYTILFENLPTATAPAQEVFVTQTLDPSLDFNTLTIQQFGFGDLIVDVSAAGDSFERRLDLRSTLGMFVDVAMQLNLMTGEMNWTFRAISPLTGDLPENPLAGFLPPNDETARGEGFVTYTIRPLAALPTGTVIGGEASIVFDVNEPIITNEVTNTLDAGPPTSGVEPLAAVSAHQFWVTWSGADEGGAGSGIAAYDVFVSDDGGPYALWLADTPDAAAVFTGQVGHTYRFYSVAVDNVGHRQAAPAAADTQTHVEQVNWQNPWNRFDINNDGHVTALDVLLIINYINADPGNTALPPPPALPPFYYDINDDRACTALDVLQLINHINNPTAEAEGESDEGSETADVVAARRAALPPAAWPATAGQPYLALSRRAASIRALASGESLTSLSAWPSASRWLLRRAAVRRKRTASQTRCTGRTSPSACAIPAIRGTRVFAPSIRRPVSRSRGSEA
jgi:RHS repeat-associated protein